MTLLLALGGILGLLLLAGVAALLIHFCDRWRRCAWCHPLPNNLSSSICFKHARQIRRASARRRAARRKRQLAATPSLFPKEQVELPTILNTREHSGVILPVSGWVKTTLSEEVQA